MTDLRAPPPAFLSGLRDLLGPAGLREGGDAAPYLRDLRDIAPGRAAAVLRPGTVEEAAEIVRRCAEARVALIPHAGGTGLVGGQLRPDGVEGVVVSVERLNRVREVSPDDDAMIVEAGGILADAQAAAEAAGRLFPLSIASEGSARIGGILGTNAGGLNVLRYGMARDLCLGVEAVLPDGSILRSLKRLRKDNTGYDLRGLLIGSEGTLGLVTAACLRLFPRPSSPCPRPTRRWPCCTMSARRWASSFRPSNCCRGSASALRSSMWRGPVARSPRRRNGRC